MSIQRNILGLNDDCFYHIFEFLPIIDWCTLRDTCVRLRTISDYCFERRSETFVLESTIDNGLSNLTTAKRVVRSFGGFMKTVSLTDYGSNARKLLPFIDRYCRSLLDLEFSIDILTLTDIELYSRLFSNLHRLALYDPSYGDDYSYETSDESSDESSDEISDETVSSCLAKCTALAELKLVELSTVPGRMESLKSIAFERCNVSLNQVKYFFTSNSQLSQIKLFDLQRSDDDNADSILEDIITALPKLEALSLRFRRNFKPNLLPVTTVTSLNRLEVSFHHVDNNIANQVLRGLAVHNGIKDFHLAQFNCTDESIGLLSALTSLKILKFTKTDRLHGGFCKTLATALPGLDEIHVLECKDTSINDIKEFVVNVPSLRRIVFNHYKYLNEPSLVPEVFLSLVEIRKRQASKTILSIYLNSNDLRRVKQEFTSSGVIDTIAAHANVLKLLPLDKGHRRTVLEYGSDESLIFQDMSFEKTFNRFALCETGGCSRCETEFGCFRTVRFGTSGWCGTGSYGSCSRCGRWLF